MLTYNPNYLGSTDIFTSNEIKLLEELNQKISSKKFLNNKSYIDSASDKKESILRKYL